METGFFMSMVDFFLHRRTLKSTKRTVAAVNGIFASLIGPLADSNLKM